MWHSLQLWGWPFVLLIVAIVIMVSRDAIRYWDFWRTRVTPESKKPTARDKQGQHHKPTHTFEGLGSTLYLYGKSDLIVLEHWGYWRRWNGAPGHRVVKFTTAGRLLKPALGGLIPGLLCVERYRDGGRWRHIGELDAIFFPRSQWEKFKVAYEMIAGVNIEPGNLNLAPPMFSSSNEGRWELDTMRETNKPIPETRH